MILLVFAPLAGIKVGIEQIVPLAITVFLISFTLTSLGFVIAWKFDSTAGYHAVMNLLLLPMWLVSGAVFSAAGATGWMRAIMMVNPLTYSLGMLRQQLTPALAAGSPAAAMSLAVTAGFSVVLLALSAWMAAQKSSRNAG